MNKFKSVQIFSVHNAGQLAVVELPEAYEPIIVGEDIEVDGTVYMINGIERFAVKQPDNQIGIMLRRK